MPVKCRPERTRKAAPKTVKVKSHMRSAQKPIKADCRKRPSSSKR